jgi:DNA-binding YbaB/EbfC family protein
MFDPRKIFDLIKNAGEMQKNMAEKLKTHLVTGEAGGGMVKVVMNGHFEVDSVNIEESVLKENQKFVEDLVKAAVNDASTQLREVISGYIKSVTGGLGS